MTDKLYLEQLYNAICYQYESIAYDMPVKHQKTCLRLLNAASELYNNALRLLRNQNSTIALNNVQLTLEQNKILLSQLYNICTELSPLPLKILAAKKTLQNISPSIFVPPTLITIFAL